ncbi:tellurium resistance protein [Desulforamulus reducens MI-1]|uniref:Tellurium resistance protein n=1 Tax=Desulforamulus reducens (strain ATCC BAA-1160 / DSM 100696 / MI-1) TaxID=349161 RepID=A4J1C9_DESRM|nr:TerD family protein [Desulforamulus reducens]ABO48882.1 tellurium resistance protein [Desulforamulus reducens MI-1]
MSINLIKGQKIDLYKMKPGVRSISMGITLCGPINNFFVTAILTGSSGKVEDTKNFIFYDNLSNHDGSVLMTKDTPPQVNVHLDRVPLGLTELIHMLKIGRKMNSKKTRCHLE